MHGAMSADTPLWTLSQVCLGEDRLRDVSLSVSPGITAVLGPSGAGKTSLLNVLVAFEKADRGIFDSTRSLFWSPQDHGLWPHCTVRQHLEHVRCKEKRSETILEAFDLHHRATAYPHELSGGERARLSVARAIAAPAEVLVMDEPLAHVDGARLPRYWSALRRFIAQESRSLVFSTHTPELVLAEAREVICLQKGRVLYTGSVADCYANPPSVAVMEALGPGNWLTPEEAELWLDESIDQPRCFRPEQVEVEPAHLSHIVVNSASFLGAYGTVELRHVNAAEVKKFVHRPAGAHLQPGLPASIRLRA